MSIVNEAGEKIEIHTAVDENIVLTTIEREWAGKNPKKWRAIAMLQLSAYCRFSHERIGRSFGISQGNVTRIIKRTTRILSRLNGLQNLVLER